jgi:hypothetical protein
MSRRLDWCICGHFQEAHNLGKGRCHAGGGCECINFVSEEASEKARDLRLLNPWNIDHLRKPRKPEEPPLEERKDADLGSFGV